MATVPFQSCGPFAERRASGQALRKLSPRSAAGGWKHAANRADPIDLLIANSAGRIEELIPLRYGRMMANPFAFYRGAAAIMAHDLSTSPTTQTPIVICGDAHLMNFGGFRTPERRLIFDINDFDEASIAPWEWDVQRLATSFHIAAAANGVERSSRDEAAWWAARSYRLNMARYARMPVLEAYYEYIDLERLIAGDRDAEMRSFDRRRVNKAANNALHRSEFAKLAYIRGDQPRIRDNPPLIFHADDIQRSATYRKTAEAMLKRYRAGLPHERQLLLDRYTLTDVALKVVGVGSVGTRCGIALFMSGKGDPLFLQFKEARTSVLEAYAGQAPFKHAGKRVVFCQKLMQAASDMFLGPTTGAEGKQFYVRQLRDAKVSPAVEVMNADNLVAFAKACGWALARAHKRSGDAVMLSGYLGRSDAFEDAMVKFSRSYAEQNERDHAALIGAVRSGKVMARTDSEEMG